MWLAARLLDVLALLLVVGAAVAFSFGVQAVAERRDVVALYWLAVGAAILWASVALARPQGGSR